jgi:site-specific recombinase XerD
MKSKLDKLKQDFLEHLEIEKNRSQLTLRNYDLYLKRFLEFAAKFKVSSPAGITLDLIRSWRLTLNRKDIKLVTQSYHMIALRSFLKYLAKRDIKALAAEKIDLPKNPSRQVEFLEQDDLQKLFDATDQEKNDLLRLRDRAILELLFSTGLRVAELASLTKQIVNLKKDEFSIKGKGGKIRIVFLSDRAREALKKYLSTRQDNSPALFVRHPAKRGKSHAQRDTIDLDMKSLTPRSIQRIVKKYAKLSGVSPRISPHTLRHTMATDLLAAGADLRSVQEILGHSSITTTQVYTHVTNKRLREVHKKYHGRFRPDK